MDSAERVDSPGASPRSGAVGSHPGCRRCHEDPWLALTPIRPSDAVAGARYHSARYSDGENVVLWDRKPRAVTTALGTEDVALQEEATWQRVLMGAHRLS